MKNLCSIGLLFIYITWNVVCDGKYTVSSYVSEYTGERVKVKEYIRTFHRRDFETKAAAVKFLNNAPGHLPHFNDDLSFEYEGGSIGYNNETCRCVDFEVGNNQGFMFYPHPTKEKLKESLTFYNLDGTIVK